MRQLARAETGAKILGTVVRLSGKVEAIVEKSGWVVVFVVTEEGLEKISSSRIPEEFLEEMKHLVTDEFSGRGSVEKKKGKRASRKSK